MKSTYQRVADWNIRAGKPAPTPGTQAWHTALENQLELIAEELGEVIDAIVNRDIDNLCKEGADLDVVVSGLNFLIGGDYNRIIDTVLVNNDIKMTSHIAEGDTWLKYWQDKTPGVAYGLSTANHGDCRFYCVKRISDDKVMKRPVQPTPSLHEFSPVMRGIA